MGMRADQDIIADHDGVPGPAAEHGVLHHDAPRSNADLPVLSGQHGPEQYAGTGPDTHRPAHDRRRRDIRAGIDLRDKAAMLNQHTSQLASNQNRWRPSQRHADQRQLRMSVGGPSCPYEACLWPE